jgi:hypothetical protein
MAMNDAGEAVAIWERQSETEASHEIQASVRVPGQGFSAPIALSTAASEPALAMTPGGEAVAVWRHFDLGSGDYLIQASTRPPGGSFSAPVDVAETVNAALPQELDLALNPAGEAGVAWIQQEPGSGLSPNPTLVKAAVRPAGGSFSTPTAISPLPLVADQSAQRPRLAIDAAGDARAVWQYDDGTDQVIQSAIRSAGASFATPEGLTGDGEDAFEPDIAMDSSGAATVVWDRRKEGSYVVQAVEGRPGGAFSEVTALSAVGPAPPGRPATTVDAAGAAAVAWSLFDGSSNVIEAATRPVAGIFSAATRLSPIGREALYPEVAIGDSGATAVVWQGSDGSNDIVQASTGSGGVFSAPISLSSAGQNAIFPAPAIDSAGDATAVWWRSDGTHTIVQAAGYDASPPILRGLSIPSSGMVGVPVSFSAAPFDVWSIAATSFSFGDGAMAEGSSVAHTYATPGTYRVTVDSKDAAGTPGSASASIKVLPSNSFTIGKLARNRKMGTATISVSVPGPGTLVLSGHGLKRASKAPQQAGVAKLPVRVRGKALATLSKRGRTRVTLKIAFSPTGGITLAREMKATLTKRLLPDLAEESSHA